MAPSGTCLVLCIGCSRRERASCGHCCPCPGGLEVHETFQIHSWIVDWCWAGRLWICTRGCGRCSTIIQSAGCEVVAPCGPEQDQTMTLMRGGSGGKGAGAHEQVLRGWLFRERAYQREGYFVSEPTSKKAIS
eukprot:5727051-Pyramimonas_sp.AAC.1